MKLSTQLMYSGNPREAADQVTALEAAGLDTVWVPEAYGFDSPTLMGYLAAKTERIEIGSAILNVYSRTPGALLQTAAGLDNVSQGRAIIGLGASGPQVIEGFHGVPYDKPLARIQLIVAEQNHLGVVLPNTRRVLGISGRNRKCLDFSVAVQGHDGHTLVRVPLDAGTEQRGAGLACNSSAMSTTARSSDTGSATVTRIGSTTWADLLTLVTCIMG